LELPLKKLILILAGLLLTCGAQGADGRNASYGQHGMALFGGKDAVYASHLPMFHAPHDAQVILKVRLADPAQDKALRARLDGKTALWTISPENFELDRLAPQAATPLRQFKADMVEGHFEQGGATRIKGATVVVEQVLVYRKLDAAVKRSDSAHYLRIGRYLVKEIDSRPDFDHIVALAAPAAAGAPVRVAKQGLSEPASAALEQALPGAMVQGTVYFYTDDLK
jgi:hypothetical protein